MVAVGGVGQRAFLVDDADAGLVGTNGDLPDIRCRLARGGQLAVQGHGGFHRGLRVEFGREGDLEQHVLHHVGAIRALEPEGLALEQHVVEAPALGAQHRRIAHLAGPGDQRQAYRAAGGVAGSPALAAAGVGGVPVGAQRLPVDPGEGHRVEDFVPGQAKHLRNHGGGGHLDQHHVVQADLVEGVFQCDAALDLMGLDHAREHVLHGQRLAPGGHVIAREPVGGGEDAA